MSDSHVVGMKNVMNENFSLAIFRSTCNARSNNCRSNGTNGRDISIEYSSDPENYLTYFMKIDNVKFKQKVLPGDTLILSAI
jgi:UDP-3-O-[3-hydroxymyristoyl] N-acetylglucosamine deacetylase/3-hydroxyacyl-[acyl-carrier-protein] dehydratase